MWEYSISGSNRDYSPVFPTKKLLYIHQTGVHSILVRHTSIILHANACQPICKQRSGDPKYGQLLSNGYFQNWGSLFQWVVLIPEIKCRISHLTCQVPQTSILIPALNPISCPKHKQPPPCNDLPSCSVDHSDAVNAHDLAHI